MWLWRYVGAFISALFLQHRLAWWASLFVTYIFGIGLFGDYGKVRTTLRGWLNLSSLPEEVPVWWIILPFLTWLIASFAHRETMRKIYAGRVTFEGPHIVYDVPLSLKGRGQVGAIDIAYMNVRNDPYDSMNGRTIEQAYGSVSVYDSKWQHVKTVDYLRWPEGQKLGYEGSPSDHFPHEWNFRILHPNGNNNRLDLFLKDKADYQAYVLCGRSQLKPLWKDENVALLPGHYKVRVKVNGTSMKFPASFWVELENPGKNASIRINRLPFNMADYWHKREIESEES